MDRGLGAAKVVPETPDVADVALADDDAVLEVPSDGLWDVGLHAPLCSTLQTRGKQRWRRCLSMVLQLCPFCCGVGTAVDEDVDDDVYDLKMDVEVLTTYYTAAASVFIVLQNGEHDLAGCHHNNRNRISSTTDNINHTI